MDYVQRLRVANLQLELDRNAAQGNVAVAQALLHQRRRRRRNRTIWVKPWLQRRNLLGQYERLMVELRDEDIPAFKNFLRVEPAMFNELLNRLGERITKKDTWYRKALDPGLKLAITLCFLATGDSYHTLMYGFRVSHSTISLIVREVCEAINEEFAAEVVQCPTTPNEWKVVADQFGERWQFFHAIGALDGKHVAIKCPRNGGSIYYNYKVSR